MRIPLDYYRILGLPIQASVEQLQQAYRDRNTQLPRQEYSQAAIVARRQIIEIANAVLSDPEQRTSYDASYFAYTNERDDNDSIATDAVQPTPSDSESLDDVDRHAPSIEIAESKFVGALLILQELGEYELVLKLGRPYLSISSVGVNEHIEPDIRSDIILTVALAHLELGREQWQQHQYENAAISLEAGKELLLREVLFDRVCIEIQADLYKLRPYRILELLARPEDNVAERAQGLKLLQAMLEERGGIDGTGDDWSGLSLDDFLRFIQQLRSYLTAVEQQSLFAAESQRPSAVATYLQVYALLGRGFAQRMPVLIRQARLLLMRLGKRQDLSLEQAICSLLLGQTETASRALELTQEYESLAFIREHSQGFPDLLPGLCIYGERWLQTEVFPHFRDLAQQQASLKDYFADEQVQSYLEALPMQIEATNEWTVVAPQSFAYAQAPHSDQASQSEPIRERVQDTTHSMQSTYRTTAIGATSSDATATQYGNPSVSVVPAAEQIAISAPNQKTAVAANPAESAKRRAPQSRRRPRRQTARSLGVLQTGETLYQQGSSSTLAFQNLLGSKKTQLLVLTGVVGIVILGFLVSQTYGWFRQASRKEPLLQGEQLLVQLDRPPLSIPAPEREVLPPKQLLNREEAALVVQSWLSTKATAFGSNHDIDELKQILVAPALSKWQLLAQKDKIDNRYRQYKHSLKVNSVQTSAAAPDQAQIKATVNEVAQLYENGRLNRGSSYNENLRVQYDLVRKNGQWRIREMKILK